MATATKKRAPRKKAAPKSLAPRQAAQAPAQAQQDQEGQIINALMKSIETGSLQPEQLDLILNAQERILDRQASQAFAADMALCQAAMPNVSKGQWNKQTESFYEDLGALNNTIKPVYTQYGFAVSFNSCAASQEGWIGMKAKVSHRMGWSEEHTFELPVDNVGIKGSLNKTVIHGVASARSYMRRYLLREIFNLTTSEDRDDDGVGPAVLVTDEQAETLEKLIKEVKANRQLFLKWAGGISDVADLPASMYDRALRTLKAKRKTNEVNQNG